ncbi:site-specific integrase [Nocardia otitidiscaviarum]|uniref:tyrosine-type recombinase/integrase n=1 Tax=Nocardia otitidiscaviarum TaxID=1823 RepID=UPI00069452DF|nr:site-specific integrase [Nocardia otitidiscaviarum]MBF6137832.1 site-specific integrase [Nocardia otitidiscaviarum]MBF6485355.1 site-specific integrase [Nocardia otitidiscaviarum]
MGQVRALPVRGVRLKDAVDHFLSTIPSANTRCGYAVALNRLVSDFGADSDVGLLEAERVGGWFVFKWGGSSAQTFNVRLASLRAACEYWRAQQWLVGDPLVRLVPRKVPPDHSRALTRDEVTWLLAADVPLRERVLWTMLYETAARAEELLMLDIPDLDMGNRCAVVTRKGGARDVVAWQSGTARLLPRLLAGRKSGPVFLTDRKAKPGVAVGDIDPSTLRGRLSYRRALELFEHHTGGFARGPFTLHQLRHSKLTHAAEDGASTPMLMRMSGHTSVRSLGKYSRPSAEALIRWQAQTDPAARRRR